LTRKKTFDEQVTLAKIGELFWRNGYVATDMTQICQAVSLNKPSIYNAYGDKAALFRKVVDWYVDDILAKGGTCLAGSAPVSEEIGALMRYFMVLPEGVVISRGCLLATTMMELKYKEPDLFDYTQSRFDNIPRLLEGYLQEAQESGRLRPSADPGVLSEYVFTMLLGLRVQARARSGQLNLDSLIAMAMGPLKEADKQPEGARPAPSNPRKRIQG